MGGMGFQAQAVSRGILLHCGYDTPIWFKPPSVPRVDRSPLSSSAYPTSSLCPQQTPQLFCRPCPTMGFTLPPHPAQLPRTCRETSDQNSPPMLHQRGPRTLCSTLQSTQKLGRHCS